MHALYFDHAATTPLDPAVLECMLPYLTGRFGNPSSLHAEGRIARHAVEEARLRVARACEVGPESIVFTSGGTESDNLAIRGLAARRPGPVVSSATEHDAVLRPIQGLERLGRTVHRLGSSSDGSVDPAAVEAALGADTAFVSLMHVNNETGAVNDLAAISAVCRHHGVPLHADAVQSPGYYHVSPKALGADVVSLSAHKIGGPKGVGALVVSAGIDLEPLIVGGNQERRRRAGTENVAGIVGFGAAMEMASADRDRESARVGALRELLKDRLEADAGDCISFVDPVAKAPHILFGFVGGPGYAPVDPEMLVLRLDLDGIRASSGSACASGTLEVGHVVRAIGGEGRGAPLRLSLGRATSDDDVLRGALIVARVVRGLASHG